MACFGPRSRRPAASNSREICSAWLRINPREGNPSSSVGFHVEALGRFTSPKKKHQPYILISCKIQIQGVAGEKNVSCRAGRLVPYR